MPPAISRWGLTIPQFAPTDRAKRARRRLLDDHKDNAVVQMLIGDAIGDAFGFGIEMQDAYWIRKNVTRFEEFPESPVLKESFRVNNVRGFYSDDCEMTVGLMKALTAHGADQLDGKGMLQAWRDEWDLAARRPPPAEPDGERQGHGSIKYVWRGECTLEECREKQANREDPGNAPPMRALPLGFVPDAWHRARLCATNADTTHPHPKARAASLLIASACRHLVVERRPASGVLTAALAALEASELCDGPTCTHLKVLDALPDYHAYGPRFAVMPEAVHALLCGRQPCPHTLGISVGSVLADSKDRGMRMHGLYTDSMRTAGAVLYLVKHQTGPLDVLTASVDLGGDVDSVAALCLGLVGGGCTGGLRLGEPGGVPWALLEKLEGVEYLVNQAVGFGKWAADAEYRAPRPRREADDRCLMCAVMVAIMVVLTAVIMGRVLSMPEPSLSAPAWMYGRNEWEVDHTIS